jgi:trk system potassium uptake protein TrkH
MRDRGRRPGDRRVRVERQQPQQFTVAPPRRLRRAPAPALSLLLLFTVLITIGTVLLMLPIATNSGEPTRFIDALFTATSAACVTGLVVVDTATHWSPFGQVVIMLLIQAGGFGIMAGSTLLLFIFVRRRTTLRDRVLVQESLGGIHLGTVTSLLTRIAIFTIVCEVIGAIVLSIAFVSGPEAGPPGDPLGIWWGIFHSISAFNNAGFDLTGGFRSLIPFRDDWVVLLVHALLLILGGLGFAIVGDVIGKRSWVRMALETKIVLLTTLALLVGGAAVIAVFEWSNPATLGALPPAQRPLNALFEATTLRTAGFSALPTGELTEASLFIVMALMFIGGASGSTAGGIKVNTFSVLLIAIVSTARGRPTAEAFGRQVPHVVIYRAIAVALLSIAVVFVVALGLELTAGASFTQVLFEAVSAVATVGASTGITPGLPDSALLILVPAMFIGRLGTLTLVLALAARAKPARSRPAVEAMRIG